MEGERRKEKGESSMLKVESSKGKGESSLLKVESSKEKVHC